MSQQIFIGPYVHSISKDKIEYVPFSIISVVKGKIEWIEKCHPSQLKEVGERYGILKYLNIPTHTKKDYEILEQDELDVDHRRQLWHESQAQDGLEEDEDGTLHVSTSTKRSINEEKDDDDDVLSQSGKQEEHIGLERVEVEVIRLDDDEFLCPGLIDTHTHAPQFPNNGLGGSLQLLEWLEKLTFPEEKKYEDLDYAKRVYERVVERTLRSGTTTSCYYATIHVESSVLLARICERRGQRAFIGKCNMDRNSPPTYIEPSTSSSLQSTHEFISHFPSPSSPTSLVRPILTPRFAISCTSALLHGLSSISNSYSPPLPIQTHLSENPSEVELAKKLYNSSTYTEIYHSHGLLRKGTILAHCVHLEPSERNLIAECGAGVSHCPTSNINLLSGSCRVVELLDQGIPVGLGTDCSGGYSIGVLNTLRDASTVSRCLAFGEKGRRWLSVEELFAMATLGGAEVCGLQDRIGNFQVGKEFDALRICPTSPGMWVGEEDKLDWSDVGKGFNEQSHAQSFHFSKSENGAMGVSGIHGDAKGWMKEWEEKEKEKLKKRFETWLWTGDDRDLAGVWVRGRKVV